MEEIKLEERPYRRLRPESDLDRQILTGIIDQQLLSRSSDSIVYQHEYEHCRDDGITYVTLHLTYPEKYMYCFRVIVVIDDSAGHGEPLLKVIDAEGEVWVGASTLSELVDNEYAIWTAIGCNLAQVEHAEAWRSIPLGD